MNTENVSNSSDNKYEQHTLYINVSLKEALIWKFAIVFVSVIIPWSYFLMITKQIYSLIITKILYIWQELRKTVQLHCNSSMTISNGEMKQKYLILPDIYCWTKYSFYICSEESNMICSHGFCKKKCLYFLLFVTSYANISNEINQHSCRITSNRTYIYITDHNPSTV